MSLIASDAPVMSDELTPGEERALRKVLARAHEQEWGIAFGLLCGMGLFAATALLLVKGGAERGAHLGLLAVYFPGYSVTWAGSFIGFVYAFVGGYGLGRSAAAIYNRLCPD
jgi:hypothetical protein